MMNRILLITGILILTIKTHAQPLLPQGLSWEPVAALTDEFNSDALDRTKWDNFHPTWKGRSPSFFVKENVWVANGNLCLKSTVARADQKGNWVAASCVTSTTKAMKAGYYSEARILCPTLSMTGAYWFQGNYSEIDVIENFGAPTGPKYQGHETHYKSNLHYFKNGWKQDISMPWEADIIHPACNLAYHVYGVWWKDERTIVFYLDGKAVHTSLAGGDFSEPMYMFFDMEVFDWGVGIPTVESLNDSTKNTQYVDWVRTYKLVEAAK